MRFRRSVDTFRASVPRTLDHYENSHEEHTLVRKAIVAAFQRARKIGSPQKAHFRRTLFGLLGQVKRLSKHLSEASER